MEKPRRWINGRDRLRPSRARFKQTLMRRNPTLFQAYRDQFPFLVGGSDEDPFEHRQVDLARERLGKLGLRIERLPGGHLTTHEQPEALAALITKFERRLARKPERAEGYSDCQT